MAVEIANLPRMTQYRMREVSRARVLSPTFGGGPDAMIQRLGTRTAMDVSNVVLPSSGCGAGLIADLLRARTEGALVRIPEPKVAPTAYGAPLVNGVGQLGQSLAIDGLTPGVTIPKGKWLSIIISGRRYAYITTAPATANGDGEVTLSIWPMIRRSPPNNATVELDQPKIEGFVQEVVERDIARIGAISVSFSVVERE